MHYKRQNVLTVRGLRAMLDKHIIDGGTDSDFVWMCKDNEYLQPATDAYLDSDLGRTESLFVINGRNIPEVEFT